MNGWIVPSSLAGMESESSVSVLLSSISGLDGAIGVATLFADNGARATFGWPAASMGGRAGVSCSSGGGVVWRLHSPWPLHRRRNTTPLVQGDRLLFRRRYRFASSKSNRLIQPIDSNLNR